MPIDLNTAGEQRSFEVIPARTILTLHLNIRPGGAGEGAWLRRASDSKSEGLDCEFTVVDEGPYKGRKLESAKGIAPDDKSDAAKAARTMSSWGDLDHLRFVARIGVRPPEGNFPAKNRIDEVILPADPMWHQPVQIDRSTIIQAPNAGGNGGVMPTPAPESAIARPQWAS